MSDETHPLISRLVPAIGSAIPDSIDDVTVVAGRRVLSDLAEQIAGSGLQIVYGDSWQAVVGFLYLTDSLEADELKHLSHSLTLRHRHLRRRALAWADDLACLGHQVRAAFHDVGELHTGDEREQTALECALISAMLQPYVTRYTPINAGDCVELSLPIAGIVAARMEAQL